MVDMDKILAQLWTAAATKGPEWLHSQVSSLLDDQACGSAAGGQELQRARRSRPPECFSLGSSPELCAREGALPGTHRRSVHWLLRVVRLDGILAVGGAWWAGQWDAHAHLPHLLGGTVGSQRTPPPGLRRGGSLCMGEVQPRLPGCYQTRPEAPV